MTKNTIFKWLFYLIPLTLLLVVSCENENLEVQEERSWREQNGHLIQKAKSWFEASMQEPSFSSEYSLSKGTGKGFLELQWQYAKVFNSSVEVPFTINGKTTLPRSQDNNSLKGLGRKRLLFTIDDNEQFSLDFISFIPSSTFKEKIWDINSQNFLQPNFTGEIQIKKFDSSLFSVWQVQKGKITERRQYVNSRNSGSPQLRGSCVPIEECTVWMTCVGFSSNPYCYCSFGEINCITWYDCTSEPDPYACPGWPWCDTEPDPYDPYSDNGDAGSGYVNPNGSDEEANMPPDCNSWQFTTRNRSGNYQVAGVSGISIDHYGWYTDQANRRVIGVTYWQFDGTYYFEMPWKRANGTEITPGQAANMCKNWLDSAEDNWSAELTRRSGEHLTQIQQNTIANDFFLTPLRNSIESFGGRLTKTNNYGASSNSYRTSWFDTDCR